MENATKALLIAAAILIILMLISTMLIFKDQLAGYFSGRHDSKMVEQLVEFNNRFENYNGQTIRGNELISVMNNIIDYNNYQAGIEGYERVIIKIDLLGYQEELKYKNESGSNTLITGAVIHNQNNDDVIKRISETSGRLTDEATSGIDKITDTKLQKMSASISNIVDDDEITNPLLKEDYKEYRKQVLKRILGYEVEEIDIPKIKQATYQYYQYTQFKRAMFKCTGVTYNTTNGRVNGMTFEVVTVTDNNGTHIKFD